jgi:hypothetical protein
MRGKAPSPLNYRSASARSCPFMLDFYGVAIATQRQGARFRILDRPLWQPIRFPQ